MLGRERPRSRGGARVGRLALLARSVRELAGPGDGPSPRVINSV
jgi:hypothetical protein